MSRKLQTNKDKIQADIAAKKQKLQELKAKRSERNARRAGGRTGGRTGTSSSDLAARLKKSRDARSKQKVDLGGLGAIMGITITEKKKTPAHIPKLSVETPQCNIFNIESIIPETFDKDIECAIIGGTDEEKKTLDLQRELQTQKLQMMEEEEKMKIFKEQLKKDKLKYDKIREEERLHEPQELTAIEVRRIESSKKFQSFITSTSKIVERALNFTYDFKMDYADVAEAGDGEESKEEKLRRKNILFDFKKTGTRAVTSISWSAKFPEILLSSYAGQDDPMSLEPDGTVLVWNMHMPNRPEYSFVSNSAVLVAQFHPSNPKLIVGGCQSGQVVVWDTRAKRTPIDRTSLSRGHTYPIYALQCLPTVHNNNLISVSTDGMLCQWNDKNLHEPVNELDLNATVQISESKDSLTTDEITTTSFDFPGPDTSSVILGSDEGKIYKARIYDQKGIWYSIDAHDAPITNVHFHPTQKNSPTNVSDLFLTSSYDWTVKLWSNKTNKALYTFESARDYVFDVQWSPTHPSVFASGDGSGKLDVWNLTVDTEVPNYSIQVEKNKGAISRLKWSEDGNHLVAGMSNGVIHVFGVAETLHHPSNDDCSIFYEKMNAETINVGTRQTPFV